MTVASDEDQMLERLLIEWNETRVEYLKDKTVQGLFEEQVERTPDGIAVIYGDEQLTYRVLNERANQVAHYLKKKGVGRGTLVGVSLNRSIDLIVGILGILKAGGAYVPLDPEYPEERLQFMLGDTGAPVLITFKELQGRFRGYKGAFLLLDDEGVKEELANISKENPEGVNVGEDLAYVVYTSGSTGQPKGVMIEYKAIYNQMMWLKETYGFSNERVLQRTSIAFDASVWEILIALITNSTLVFYQNNGHFDEESLIKEIYVRHITVLQVVPSILKLLLVSHKISLCKSLQYVFAGGEALENETISNFETLFDIPLYNLYGPTEVTINSIYTKAKKHKKHSLIGKPISNTKIYILDERRKPVPIGAMGEIYIGGAGLARGYLNRPELTEERFIENPFVSEEDKRRGENQRLYRTGDLGRYLPDGNIEYMGRIDDQVKIRGYRIELGEIESVIAPYNEIKQCIVLAQDHRVQSEAIVEVDKALIAYYVKKNTLDSKLVGKNFIADWQKLYQEEYSGIDDDNFQANFDGWISSYTEAPFNHDEMLEWLGVTTSRILSLKPKVVLEIGSGSGLILFNLLKDVDYYIGTDFSQNVIDYTHRVVEKFDSKDKVSLFCSAADLIPYSKFRVSYDTVIINSVVQYFPNLEYLTTVINQAIENIKVSGKIFIGDVRDYRLLECFHYSVQKFKRGCVTQREISYFARKDKELLISPKYFLHLKKKNNSISYVELMPKLGKAKNELNCYRYDVIIHVNKNTGEKLLAIDEANFIETDNIIDYIKAHSSKEFLYIKYKNFRIINDYTEYQKICNPDFEASYDKQNNLLSIDEILIQASSMGYNCKFFLDIHYPLYVSIILFRSDLYKDNGFYINYSEKLPGSRLYSKLSNNPALADLMINTEFGKKLKAYLENKLPKYMIPEYYIELEEIPLTHNGKVDKKALPVPYMDMVVAQQYVEPRDEIEQKLCNIWAEVLGLERVGIHDNFFEIGGHSLLATRVVSRIRAIYSIELPLKDLFTAPTVEQLSQCIKGLQQEFEGKGNVNVPELRRITRPERIPLSFAQQRLWFLDQLYPNHTLYNVPMAFRLRGEFNREAFESALRYLVNRHEVLRTRIGIHEGEGYQEIRGVDEFRVGWEDISNQPEADQEVYVKETVEREAGYRFKLNEECLFRAHVIRVGNDVHVLIMNMHHIISDGWSCDIFARELSVAYEAYRKGEVPGLEPLGIQYGDFAIWQRSWLQGEALERQLEYWKESLRGAPESIGLPTDYERPKELTYEGGIYTREISGSLLKKVKALGDSEGATLFMTLLSVFNIVLYKNSGQEDMVIGSPIANRHYKEIEGLIGFFVNTLALRTRIDPKASFREVLRRVKEAALGAYSHQDIPFEQLVDHLNITRTVNQHPLYQIVFVLQNFENVSFELADLEIQRVNIDTVSAPVDMRIWAVEHNDNLLLGIDYAKGLFACETIERIGKQFERMLEAVVEAPEAEVGSYEIMDEVEKNLVLVEWNETRVEYPKDKTVQELFEEQVERTPDGIAVIYGDEQLTYMVLNERANQVAHYLKKKGVGRGTLVGVSLNRSIDLIVGILGILKAGGAYVPLDPEYPEERLQFMLGDTGAPVLVTHSECEERFPYYSGMMILLDEIDQELSREEKKNPGRVSMGEDLAYVIYTSGSTGQPKGVMIEHRGLMNLALAQSKEFEINNSTKVLQFFSWSFDASVSEWSTTLISGAILCIPPLSNSYNLDQILDYIDKYQIDVLTLPPKVSLMIQDHHKIKTLVVAGEECMEEVRTKWLGRTKLINAYGPTESTVCATLMVVNNSRSIISIGKPISNTKIYILDERRKPVPIGAMGEIYIGGAGLARGYLNRPELTEERFIENPFVSEEDKRRGENQRLYRTGDLGRYLPDGNIEYMGRIDDQVKIRGYRIELGEIESALNRCGEVHSSVVVARAVDEGNSGQVGSGDKRLVAYVVPGDGIKSQLVVQGTFKSSMGDEVAVLGGEHYAEEVRGLKERLGKTLPEYMVPSAIVFIEKVPLTHNGKVDKKALPAPDMDMVVAQQYVEPRDEIEQKLCNIWAEVLGLERVGIHDNFFEIGGHSLLATRVVSRIRAIYSIELPLKDLFTAPTVEQLSQCIKGLQQEFEGKGNVNVPELRRITRPERIPLSFAQQRLWFLDQLYPNHTLYNVPMAFRLRGEFNREAFESALRYLVNRHEVLRTRIGIHEGEGYQEIRGVDEFRVGWEDISNQPEADQEVYVKETVEREAGYRFKLNEECLFRAHVIRVGNDVHVLIMNMHHIISDGWSCDIFARELSVAYEAYRKGEVPGLEPLGIQYGDFAIWQRSWLQGEALERQLEYWKESLRGAPESIGLPTDYERPKELTYEGGIYTREISGSLLKKVKALGDSEGATLFMTLLSVFNIVLYKNSGQEDMVIGSPIANRHYKEIEGLIGFFVNTLALRTRIDPKASFREVLRRVKEAALGAYSHQDIPFEQLVDHLNITRQMNQNPVFQIIFDLHNQPHIPFQLLHMEIERVDVGLGIAKFDLSVFIHEADDKMFLGIEYLKDIFSGETIERIGKQFERVLEAVVEAPEAEVGSYEIMDEVEKKRVLVEWNETRVEYPKDKTVQELFEEQVERTPDGIAVIYGDEQLTYRALNERANQVAHYLKKKGIGRGTLVGVSLNRSIDLIVGILGVLKAGGAYVPLDPEHPEERLQFMLGDTGAPVLVTHSECEERFPYYSGMMILLDEIDQELSREENKNPERVSMGEDLVYVIYTSGSTGQPKGVMIEHRSLGHYIHWSTQCYNSDGKKGSLIHSSMAFDMPVTNLFVPLISGSKVVLMNKISLEEVFKHKYEFDFVKLTPSHIRILGESLTPEVIQSDVRKVVIGGEGVYIRDLETLRKILPNVVAYNEYGPTEATVGCIVYEMNTNIISYTSLEQAVPIGKPISNTKIYILDERRKPVPIGAMGEIYIGGAGLARGYLNRPELTEERFIENPFVSEEDKRRGENQRLYRTGDLGRYLPDGNIEYMGRIDDQVKIRGYRIELGEIESALNRCGEVHSSVVVARAVDEGNSGQVGSGDKRLVAYVVPGDGIKSQLVVQGTFKSSMGDEVAVLGGEHYAEEVRGLKERLGKTLPEYMVPSAIVFIEKVPLTHNGKVDKKALPAPDMDMVVAQQYVEPRDEIEQKLCNIWAEVLGLERVGIHDNFFEIGGHSLLATRVVSRIRAIYSIELPLKDLFTYPTLFFLSPVITSKILEGEINYDTEEYEL